MVLTRASTSTLETRTKGLVTKLPNSRRNQRCYTTTRSASVPEGLRVYAPLTAGLLSPIKADAKLESQRRTHLDPLYQRLIDDLEPRSRCWTQGLRCAADPNTIYLNASEETSYIVGIESAVVIGVARPCYRNTDASRTPRLDQSLLVQDTEPRR